MTEGIDNWTNVSDAGDISSHVSKSPPPEVQRMPTSKPQQHEAHASNSWHSTSPVEIFYDHSSAPRVNTDALLADAIHAAHPRDLFTIIPISSAPLLSLAAANLAIAIPLINEDESMLDPLTWHIYIPPTRRINNDPGSVGIRVIYGKYSFIWKDRYFLLYIIDGRDGSAAYPNVENQYLIGPLSDNNSSQDSSKNPPLTKAAKRSFVNDLIREAGNWNVSLHKEIWVYDGGYWHKDSALYESVMKAGWEKVILEDGMKKALQKDVERFFDGGKRYGKLQVPWKRGVIFYGPPGNGKTVSIKAIMKTSYQRKDPVPSLYVRSLASFGGPEGAISQIFQLARSTAPCILIFEDLDSIVTDSVRSYFLNQVDGLNVNDGIFMIGSTNHLDRLDPGIAKRPSRFDRKFLFPKPDLAERTKYAEFWRLKVLNGGNGDKEEDQLEFPKSMCNGIAKLTDGFSFAYMQEAFVATLSAIAAHSDDESDTSDSGSDDEDDDDCSLEKDCYVPKTFAKYEEQIFNHDRSPKPLIVSENMSTTQNSRPNNPYDARHSTTTVLKHYLTYINSGSSGTFDEYLEMRDLKDDDIEEKNAGKKLFSSQKDREGIRPQVGKTDSSSPTRECNTEFEAWMRTYNNIANSRLHMMGHYSNVDWYPPAPPSFNSGANIPTRQRTSDPQPSNIRAQTTQQNKATQTATQQQQQIQQPSQQQQQQSNQQPQIQLTTTELAQIQTYLSEADWTRPTLSPHQNRSLEPKRIKAWFDELFTRAAKSRAILTPQGTLPTEKTAAYHALSRLIALRYESYRAARRPPPPNTKETDPSIALKQLRGLPRERWYLLPETRAVYWVDLPAWEPPRPETSPTALVATPLQQFWQREQQRQRAEAERLRRELAIGDAEWFGYTQAKRDELYAFWTSKGKGKGRGKTGRRSDKGSDDRDGEYKKLKLWKEMKRQIEILRKEM